jgi:ribosomal protein S18 acetylase RimI-like enzyme
VTDDLTRLNIEPLADNHDRSGFFSGSVELDRYLSSQIGQDVRKKVACAYVLVCVDLPTQILGFYTLSSTVIALDDLPPSISKRLPRYPAVPATLLGRLAVSKNHQGRGYGRYLLLDAMAVAYEQSSKVASAALVVSAKDESAQRFYQQYGFIGFSDDRSRLFLPMKTIEVLIAPSE